MEIKREIKYKLSLKRYYNLITRYININIALFENIQQQYYLCLHLLLFY